MTKTIHSLRADLLLFYLFCGSAVACVGLTFAARLRGVILVEDLGVVLQPLAELYSAPIGLLSGALLAWKRSIPKIPRQMIVASLILSAVWNILPIVECGDLAFGAGTTKSGDIAEFCKLMTKWSFLTACGLGYVVGKASSEA